MKIFSTICAGILIFSVSAPVLAAEAGVQIAGETVSSEKGKGELQVSIESAPLLGSTPRGATRVEMAYLNISASCDADITVEGIEVTHIGLGSTTDISAVYLFDQFRRVSRARTFDSRSRKASLRVTSFTVRKCEAVRVRALVDISANANVASEHGITIDSASAITSSAKTTTLLQSDATQRVIASPNQAGSVTVNFLPIKGPLRYGRTETVARLQLTSDSTYDHLLRSITFTNLGDARDMNLINFTLQNRKGEILSPVAQRMRAYTVTLDFDPTYILERGRTVVFLLKAQINASQSKQVNFTIQEPSDLDAMLYRPSR